MLTILVCIYPVLVNVSYFFHQQRRYGWCVILFNKRWRRVDACFRCWV